MISIFKGTEAVEIRENHNNRVFRIPSASAEDFAHCHDLLLRDGYIKKEENISSFHQFAAFEKNGEGVFLNFYQNTNQLMAAVEKNTAYFSYTDTVRTATVAPQITQVHLEDFGMSYAIRLSDGRFIVIDGGRDFEPDRRRLFDCLTLGSPYERPVIAAWIMSHPHSDHFHCFLGFMEQYGDCVEIEKFMFLFPEADDLGHYPKLAKTDPRFSYDTSESVQIPRMLDWMQKVGAPIYTPHTGQRYRIGDADCEFLASMDDTVGESDNINTTSLVIRMKLAGQIILWSTDASFSYAKLPERYGSYLKSDILQVPHHGFQSGKAEGEIAGYELIQPHVCLLPVSDFNAYTAFCIHKKGTAHLMRMKCVEEIITGETQRTLTLPYTPRVEAKREHIEQYRQGLSNCGSRVWVFSELCTAREDDFVFSLLNTTHTAATVWIELFFADKSRAIRAIRATISPLSLQKLCVIGDQVDHNAFYFNNMTVKERGIPENEPFAVRFRSDVPLVISHPVHQANYHA